MPLTKIQSLGITDGTIVNADINASAAITTSKLSGGTNTPAFYAYKTGDQSISNETETVVQFNAEYYDTNSNFNTSNYRFTPSSAGKYLLIASFGIDENVTFNRFIIYIRKNGSGGFTQRRAFYYGTNEQTALNIAIVEANGSSDYFTVGIFQGSGGDTTLLADGAYTFFQGFKLIE